jgi:hypothetical protein
MWTYSNYGPVYMCDSAYESLYDSVYDFLHRVVCNLTFKQISLDMWLQAV